MPSRARYGSRSVKTPRKKRLGTIRDDRAAVQAYFSPRNPRLMRYDGNEMAEREGRVLVKSEHFYESLNGVSEKAREDAKHLIDRLRDQGEKVAQGKVDFTRDTSRKHADDAFNRLLDRKRRLIIRGELAKYYARKRENKKTINRLFQNPVRFKIGNKKAYILSTGIESKSVRTLETHAFVCVFINGKQVFFYRSSGKNSGHVGMWLPYDRLSFMGEVGNETLGHIEKLAGHPFSGEAHRFPAWVDVVSKKISDAVARGKIQLESNASANDLRRFQTVLSIYPNLLERDSESFDARLKDLE